MRGHVRKRGKKWAVVVDLGQDEDGRRRQHWQTCNTKREAEAALTETLNKLDHQDFTEPSKQTVAGFFDEWLESTRTTIRASTWINYQAFTAAHIVPRLGRLPLRKLTVSHLNGFYADLLAEGRVGQGQGGLAASTVRYVHAIVHKALRDATKWGRLTKNVADLASPPRQRGRPPLRTWTGPELRSFLESVEGHRFYSVYYVAATTGARRGEVLGLRWRDVDLTTGRLAIVQTRARTATGEGFSTPKTARGQRSVAIDPRTVAVLQAHRRRQLEQRLALGIGGPGPDGLVFTNEDSTPITHAQVSADFRARVKASDLPSIRFHDLRHTHATLALAAGVHPKVVSERLGHSTVSITLDVYSHAIPAMEEEAAAKVAALVFGA